MTVASSLSLTASVRSRTCSTVTPCAAPVRTRSAPRSRERIWRTPSVRTDSTSSACCVVAVMTMRTLASARMCAICDAESVS